MAVGDTSSRLVIRSTSGVSMHSEATRHGVGGPGCARPLARPRAARHHIRRDARVWAQPKWNHALVAQQAEQPPCKRLAARSNRRRGHQTCRVRLDGRGHRAFNPGTRVRVPHATPEQRSPRRAHASRVEIGRDDWAAPEPVTGWNVCFVNSVARVPACLAGSRGFDSRTRRQIRLPR